MSNEIKANVDEQCEFILSTCPHDWFDEAELQFLRGEDRSTSASAQLDYLGHLVERHYIVMHRHLTSYNPIEIKNLTLNQIDALVQDSMYLGTRITSMANYARNQRNNVKEVIKEVTAPSTEPLYHWTNEKDGRSILLSKSDMFDWIVQEYLSPQNINKIINGTRNVEKGWRLVRDAANCKSLLMSL